MQMQNQTEYLPPEIIIEEEMEKSQIDISHELAEEKDPTKNVNPNLISDWMKFVDHATPPETSFNHVEIIDILDKSEDNHSLPVSLKKVKPEKVHEVVYDQIKSCR